MANGFSHALYTGLIMMTEHLHSIVNVLLIILITDSESEGNRFSAVKCPHRTSDQILVRSKGKLHHLGIKLLTALAA